MKIIREGKEYELTPRELSEAYCEKMDEIIENEKAAIKETIQIDLHEYIGKEQAEQLINNEEFLQEMADNVHDDVHNHGVDFDYVIRFAFDEILYKYLDNEGDDADDLHML